ncbi:unnamed protein product [Anisakis simplex]|uniref:Cyclic AMP response element-binding protein B (inferred by orthology to a D. melanogaster protein) n=1 Tax=Anisakis simplex TaxID=6269 RepID=A0A0M3K4Q9_ANISI|nr:unnamed protein product [Anisakis simplex]
MILKDLETVDKQLKKDPDEPSATPIVVQISAQQPQPSNTPNATILSNQMNEHRNMPSRLEQPSYIPPSDLQMLSLSEIIVEAIEYDKLRSIELAITCTVIEHVIYNNLLKGVLNLNVQSNGEVSLNPLTGMSSVAAPPTAATMIGQYPSPASNPATAASVSRGAATPKQVMNHSESYISRKQFQELGPSTGPSSASVGGMLPLNTDVLGLKTMTNDAPTFTAGNQGMSPEWQTGMMSGYNSSPSPLGMASASRNAADNDDSTRKRQVRLLKNREAAKECRRKKKEYVKCLENRVAVLENQNKALIEELKTLKELYCRKEKTEL